MRTIKNIFLILIFYTFHNGKGSRRRLPHAAPVVRVFVAAVLTVGIVLSVEADAGGHAAAVPATVTTAGTVTAADTTTAYSTAAETTATTTAMTAASTATQPAAASTAATEPLPTDPTTTHIQQPAVGSALLSFAGDCCLGSEYQSASWPSSFDNFVGDNYSYVFQNVRDIFGADDLTLVNLETTLTTATTPVDKQYRFKGRPQNVNMLTAGNIEAVTFSNNHSHDYGQAGFDDTTSDLDGAGVLWSGYGKTFTYTTASGIKIGVTGYSSASQYSYPLSANYTNSIRALKAEGCDVVVFTMHWGIEHTYTPLAAQQTLAHQLIDAGADIVVGTHPHVLQPVEEYNGRYILYSLGNFTFGGNPADKDSAIAQVKVDIDADGYKTFNLNVIPCLITSGPANQNNYQPTPVPVDTTDYNRIMGKLGLT